MSASSSWAETTIASLHAKGHRNSGARRAVVELLGRQDCCLTAQEIFDQLRAEGRRVGIASVYRVLEQLSKDGFVQRIDIGAGTTRFEPIHADGEHHHHLVCDRCGRVEEVALGKLEPFFETLKREFDFEVDRRHFALVGVCGDCRLRAR